MTIKNLYLILILKTVCMQASTHNQHQEDMQLVAISPTYAATSSANTALDSAAEIAAYRAEYERRVGPLNTEIEHQLAQIARYRDLHPALFKRMGPAAASLRRLSQTITEIPEPETHDKHMEQIKTEKRTLKALLQNLFSANTTNTPQPISTISGTKVLITTSSIVGISAVASIIAKQMKAQTSSTTSTNNTDSSNNSTISNSQFSSLISSTLTHLPQVAIGASVVILGTTILRALNNVISSVLSDNSDRESRLLSALLAQQKVGTQLDMAQGKIVALEISNTNLKDKVTQAITVLGKLERIIQKINTDSARLLAQASAQTLPLPAPRKRT